MKVPIDLAERLFRSRDRRHATPASQAPLPAAAEAFALDDAEAEACDRLLRELAAGALLVQRGVATRVVVCNAPGAIDFDEVRLIADMFDVTVEPIIRVGGGGFDLAVRVTEASRG